MCAQKESLTILAVRLAATATQFCLAKTTQCKGAVHLHSPSWMDELLNLKEGTGHVEPPDLVDWLTTLRHGPLLGYVFPIFDWTLTSHSCPTMAVRSEFHTHALHFRPARMCSGRRNAYGYDENAIGAPLVKTPLPRKPYVFLRSSQSIRWPA